MEKLRSYLRTLDVQQQTSFATQCSTSISYIRKAICMKKPFGERLCMLMELHSGGAVTCNELRPEIDWDLYKKWVDSQDQRVRSVA